MSANTLPYQTRIADWVIPDPGASGAIPNDQTGTVEITTAAAETRTLAAPGKSGLELTLVAKTIVTSCTITATNYTEAGDDDIVFSNAGEFIVLKSVAISTSAYAWRKVGGDPVSADAITAISVTASDYVSIDSTAFGTDGLFLTGTAAVSQATNINTARAIVASSGTITTQAASTATAGEDSFNVTNASLLGTEVVVLSPKYNGTNGTPCVFVSDQAAGSFTITIANLDATNALNGTFNINYAIISLS